MNDLNRAGIRDLARLYLDIALFRRGPQDVPASRALLGVTLLAYFVVNLVLGALLPPVERGFVLLLSIGALLTLAWYRAVLGVAGRPARYGQTVTALFGYQTVLAPLGILGSWLYRNYVQSPTWQLPILFLLLVLALWDLAIQGRILRSSTEWPVALCVGVVLLYLYAQRLLYTQLALDEA